jgi:hypothetical protein
MGGYFWQEAVSSPNSLVGLEGLEAHVFAVVTALGMRNRDQNGAVAPTHQLDAPRRVNTLATARLNA